MHADDSDGRIANAPSLPDASIEHRRLEPWIGADEEDRVGLVDAADAGIEQIAGAAAPLAQGRAILAAVEVHDAETGHQLLKREHLLHGGEVADDDADALGRGCLEFLGNPLESFSPQGRPELAE